MSVESLLSVRDLAVQYGTKRAAGREPVVQDVSFDLGTGRVYGIVGESGSGKSTIARAILGLVPVLSGSICLDGNPVDWSTRHRRLALSRDIQAIFQNPYGSLNPTKTVGDTLLEPLRVDGRSERADKATLVSEMLVRVGLNPGAARRYPASFSGGERQRIAIARALMPRPRVIICDEILSALDVSVRAQVMDLMLELKEEMGLSYVFIGHDLDVVRYLADDLLILYRGRIVEAGAAETVCADPQHPYAQALFAAATVPDPRAQAKRRRRRQALRGARVVTPRAAEQGCRFSLRCPHVIAECREVEPALSGYDGHEVACHLASSRPPVA